MVARIGPLLPAFATVGASLCASSLLLTTGPQALGPPPVVPPLTTKVGVSSPRSRLRRSPCPQPWPGRAPGRPSEPLRPGSPVSDIDAHFPEVIEPG
jgi:hypothetical protein